MKLPPTQYHLGWVTSYLVFLNEKTAEMARTTFHRFDFLDNLELMLAWDYQQDFPVHFHDSICITLVQNGVECTEVEGKQLITPIGSLSLTYPEEVHANPNLNADDYSFITYYLSPDFVAHKLGEQNFRFKDRVVDDQWLYQQLYHWAMSSQKSLSGIQLLFSHLIHAHLTITSNMEQEKEGFHKLGEILDYMERHYSEKIHIEELAHMADKSKFAFIRAFKKEKGITPGNFLMIKRLEKAKEILKRKNSIVDACYQSGFYDQSHFSRYFKKYHGLTPQQYQSRRNIIQD